MMLVIIFDQNFLADIKYKFTSILDSEEEMGQCVLCLKIHGNHSLRPSKLMLCLEKVLPEHKQKCRVFQKKRSLCEASALGCKWSISTTIPNTC